MLNAIDTQESATTNKKTGGILKQANTITPSNNKKTKTKLEK